MWRDVPFARQRRPIIGVLRSTPLPPGVLLRGRGVRQIRLKTRLCCTDPRALLTCTTYRTHSAISNAHVNVCPATGVSHCIGEKFGGNWQAWQPTPGCSSEFSRMESVMSLGLPADLGLGPKEQDYAPHQQPCTAHGFLYRSHMHRAAQKIELLLYLIQRMPGHLPHTCTDTKKSFTCHSLQRERSKRRRSVHAPCNNAPPDTTSKQVSISIHPEYPSIWHGLGLGRGASALHHCPGEGKFRPCQRHYCSDEGHHALHRGLDPRLGQCAP